MDATKVAVITGASKGIGAALVAGYRGLGYAVVANSRSIQPSTDPMVLAVDGDIAAPGIGERVIRAGLAAFGRIDTLVNNAGLFISKPFTEYTEGDFNVVTAVNLRGFFEVSRPAIAAMLAAGGGHLVNISTTLVEHANAGVPAALTALTKGGLNAVTRSLAIEYAGRGIRVNALSLGIIRSSAFDDDGTLADMHPMQRLGEVDDVVGAVIYLERAAFVTGEILHVDGGQSAGH